MNISKSPIDIEPIPPKISKHSNSKEFISQSTDSAQHNSQILAEAIKAGDQTKQIWILLQKDYHLFL